MANVLSTDKKIAIMGALTEGSSIRSIERMTGVHRDIIMRLGVKVGQGCTALMDAKMVDLSCNRIVEVFTLEGHPQTATSPLHAVRAAILQEYCDAQTV